jgi:N-acetylglucosamine kinase-like BadF-type ATPase
VSGDELVLGLDIGGSSSRARLSKDGRIVAEASGPGANVAEIPPRVIRTRLTALISELGSPKPVACCAGCAGAEVPEAGRRLERLLARLLPGTRVLVVHDARLVLAAAGFDSGIALISGTGSVAFGRDAAGREARVGGWGWMLGDEGSGVWIAREGARELMRRLDAGEPAGAMGDAFLSAVSARDLAALTGRLHALREPGAWAELAGAVFEAAVDDAGARDVIARAAAALARLVEQIQTRLSLRGPTVLAGGLLLHQSRLEAELKERIGDAVRLEEPPVAGAVKIAEAMQAGRNSGGDDAPAGFPARVG